jgi:hypothetical protein
MSAIDIMERKNTEGGGDNTARRELLVPATNLDRRESSSEKPVPSNIDS